MAAPSWHIESMYIPATKELQMTGVCSCGNRWPNLYKDIQLPQVENRVVNWINQHKDDVCVRCGADFIQRQ
jgi:hypothetical protein